MGVSNNIVDICGISGEINGTVMYEMGTSWSNYAIESHPAHIKIWTNMDTFEPFDISGVNDLSNQWNFEISGVKYDISRVQTMHDEQRDQSYIRLDISCLIHGYGDGGGTNASIMEMLDASNGRVHIFKTDICRNNYKMNIRNKKGNYLRYNGINISLKWALDLTEHTNAIIDKVYVNEIYPSRLYFKVHLLGSALTPGDL